MRPLKQGVAVRENGSPLSQEVRVLPHHCVASKLLARGVARRPYGVKESTPWRGQNDSASRHALEEQVRVLFTVQMLKVLNAFDALFNSSKLQYEKNYTASG